MTQTDSPLSQYKYIFVVFVGLISIGPLAMDTYLPAFPQIADYLALDIASIQLTLVTFLLGSTLGQFLGGPLSDSVGRLRIALAGSVLFCLASLGIAVTNDFSLLLIARAAQGFAAGAAGVVVSAIIAEHYSGKEAARTMSAVTLVMMGVPLIAPLIGTALLKLSDWHSIFYFLACYGAGMAILIRLNSPRKRLRPESEERRNLVTGTRRMLRNYRAVLAKPIGRLYLVAMGMNIAVYMVFATSASFAYMTYLGASLELFPFLLGANTISLVIGNRLGVYLLRYHEPYKVCMIGSATLVCCCLVLLLSVIVFEPTLTMVVGLIIVVAGAIPISGPIASSVFMQLYDENAGTASAAMGVSRVLFGMLGGFLVTLAFNGTLYPMVSIMFAISVIGAVCFNRAGRAMALHEILPEHKKTA